MKAQGLAKAKGKEKMERGNVLVLQSLKSYEASGSSYPMVSQSVIQLQVRMQLEDHEPGDKCAKGWHVCAEPGCQKNHSLTQHGGAE